MNRRAFLGLSGGFLADGCISRSIRHSGGDLPPTTSIAESDEVAEQTKASLSVEMLNRTVTEREPAIRRVTLRNDADHARTFETAPGSVFAGYVSLANGGNKLIVRCNCPGIDPSDKVASDCWRWDHEDVGASDGVWNEELAHVSTCKKSSPSSAIPTMQVPVFSRETLDLRINTMAGGQREDEVLHAGILCVSCG